MANLQFMTDLQNWQRIPRFRDVLMLIRTNVLPLSHFFCLIVLRTLSLACKVAACCGCCIDVTRWRHLLHTGVSCNNDTIQDVGSVQVHCEQGLEGGGYVLGLMWEQNQSIDSLVAGQEKPEDQFCRNLLDLLCSFSAICNIRPHK